MSMMNANAAATTAMTANEPLDFELPEMGDSDFSRRGYSFNYIEFSPAGHKLPIPDVIFEISKSFFILGHPLIGFSVVIGKADEVL